MEKTIQGFSTVFGRFVCCARATPEALGVVSKLQKIFLFHNFDYS